MSTHNIHFYGEAILMSTHNIYLYGELMKIILHLSSNTLLTCSTDTHLICFADCLVYRMVGNICLLLTKEMTILCISLKQRRARNSVTRG